ncbi:MULTISPECIES: hypothetical protein [Actinomadura]|uniref:DUF4352 domain-containing protein n=1 Tax=Actinomadura yumaensis TaxID=111807 RepID=A0ABW2CXF2_9ACTN|nr:hypothetical protein [Actinomadura sp. J1-007]MWK39589.1 hypothetical protein [Actinomadura sp. J1-007]
MALVVLAAGCGGGGSDDRDGPEAGAGETSAPPAAASAPAALRVGQPHRYADGLQITVTRLRVAKRAQLDPTAYDKPASWKGVLVDVTATNGSSATVKLDRPVTVTAGPNDAEGTLASYDGPGSVSGASFLGDAPLLAGRTRKLTAGVVVESPQNVTLTFGADGGDQPDVTVVGNAS